MIVSLVIISRCVIVIINSSIRNAIILALVLEIELVLVCMKSLYGY